MKRIKFEELKKSEKPTFFTTRGTLTTEARIVFQSSNEKNKRKVQYKGCIDARTLCACSALPFIEGTVEINRVTYCEGAFVDTVNFESLLEEHHNRQTIVEEIWVSRIVDSKQIQKPKNLHDALANLCQLFAATVGEDDVRLFKYHIRYDKKSETERRKRRRTLRSWRFTFRVISTSNEITATWIMDASWEKSLRSRQSKLTRNMRGAGRKTDHISSTKSQGDRTGKRCAHITTS